MRFKNIIDFLNKHPRAGVPYTKKLGALLSNGYYMWWQAFEVSSINPYLITIIIYIISIIKLCKNLDQGFSVRPENIY